MRLNFFYLVLVVLIELGQTHKLRHSKVSYASSTITNRGRIESFSLNCPHVEDSINKKLLVTWTLNDTIWLKIDNGHNQFVNGEFTFNKRRIAGKTVMRLLLNQARYAFDYNELSGDFSMEISPIVLPADIGTWQCHVTVRALHRNHSHTMTSRRRIKPGVHKIETSDKFDELIEFDKRLVEKRRSSQSVASFSRMTDDTVYITRKFDDDSNMVIFDRKDKKRPVRPSISRPVDYESSYYAKRSTLSSSKRAIFTYLLIPIIIIHFQ